jgi:hypothetical protein
MDAFLAEFKVVVFADDQADAIAKVRVWRSLSTAAGFEPGPGRVSKIRPADMTQALRESLEKAHAKRNPPATDYARTRAIEGLATQFAGDLDFAHEVVKSIEEKTGPLPALVADALANVRKPAEVAA